MLSILSSLPLSPHQNSSVNLYCILPGRKIPSKPKLVLLFFSSKEGTAAQREQDYLWGLYEVGRRAAEIAE